MRSNGLLFVLFSLVVMTASGCLGKKTEIAKVNGNPSANSSNVPIRWPAAAVTSTGIDLRISTSIANFFVPADEVSGLDPVEQMGKEWNDSNGTMTLFRIPANSTGDLEPANIASYEDGTFGIYRHNTWFSNVSSSALAVTQWLGQRKNIGSSSEFIELFEGDIIFNYANFTFTTNSGNNTDFDFHTVLLHEMGHFVGLTHFFGSQTSIMTSFLGPSDVIRAVQSIDKNNLSTNYGLSSLTASSTSAVVSALSSGVGIPKDETAVEGEILRGISELRADGTCIHKVNDIEVHRHYVDPHSLK